MKKYIALLLLFSSCVHDDNFKVPEVIFEKQPKPENIASIGAVKGNLAQVEDGIFTFSDPDIYMEGYVISNDEAGNFFEELVLQDKPENPTAGIVLQVDVNPLFTKYEFGRKVYIKLEGLTATVVNGTVQLGVRDAGSIAPLQASLVDDYVTRSEEVAEITPLEIDITEFSDDLENLYIQLKNVQFNRKIALGENRKTFASQATDEFDGERLLESCNSRGRTIVSTSTYSDFRAMLLPQGSGSIKGVLSRDFYDEFFVVNINSPADIDFSNELRCDPEELTCGIAATAGDTILFQDDFEDQKKNKPVSGNGWTNFIESGSSEWEAYTAESANASQGISAKIDSYSTDDTNSIAWLITPPLQLDTLSKATLHFETSNSFADGSDLEVLFSTDWDGNPETITTSNWGIVSSAYVTQDDDYFGDWFGSGLVDLSCETGAIYIAFKYYGNGRDANDGTYELDNVKITGDSL